MYDIHNCAEEILEQLNALRNEEKRKADKEYADHGSTPVFWQYIAAVDAYEVAIAHIKPHMDCQS